MKINSYSNIGFIVFIIIFIVVLFAGVINYIFNSFEITITIKDKYIKSYRQTTYTVVDTNNNIYNVNNAWFIGDFNKAEDYNLMDKGSTYKVKGFGFRVDMLGWYPTIYNIQKA